MVVLSGERYTLTHHALTDEVSQVIHRTPVAPCATHTLRVIYPYGDGTHTHARTGECVRTRIRTRTTLAQRLTHTHCDTHTHTLTHAHARWHTHELIYPSMSDALTTLDALRASDARTR